MNRVSLMDAPQPHPLSRRDRGIEEAPLRGATEI